MGGFSTVTPSAQSATAVAQAVWSYTPRSLTDIQSLVSAIQNNDPSLLSTPSDLQYVPVPYYAGQVSLTQVAAFIDNAVRNYGLAGAFGGFISNNPYNLWTTNFVQSLTLNPYLTATSLIMLITNGAVPANIAQFFLYTLAQNYYYNKWIYTITANAPSSITFSANAKLSTNVLIAQNITIASGVTVTCGTRTCLFVAQSFNNYGTVVAYGGTGGVPTGGAGVGGTGGGGIVVVAVTAALGTFNLSGSPGGNASGYTATANGGAGGVGVFYIVTGVTVPLGGTGGQGNAGYVGIPGYNGGGGGTANNYNGGTGGIATVYSFSSPNAMVTYILQGLSDWWLINVVGKTPSSTTPLALIHGSGGGAGGVFNGDAAGGGAGGGGGEAVVYGYNILSGTINAAGGNGGNGVGVSGYNYGGGGGGGGGLAFIFYGAAVGTITANMTGGVGGVGSTSLGNGLAGANGTAYIAKVTVNG